MRNGNKTKTTQEQERRKTETETAARLLTFSEDQEQPQDLKPITATETETTAGQDQDGEQQAKVYQDQIYFWVDDFNEREYPNKTEEELKENRAYFPQLIRHIYNNYIKGLLHTDTTKRSYRENKYNI